MDDLLTTYFPDPSNLISEKVMELVKAPKNEALLQIMQENPFPILDNSTKIVFKLNFNNIVLLSVHKYSNHDDVSYCISYLLFSFLSWKEMEESDDKFEILLFLIKALEVYADDDLIEKTLLYLFTYYLKLNEHKNILQVTSVIKSYYYNHKCTPQNAFYLIIAFLKLQEYSFLFETIDKCLENCVIDEHQADLLIDTIFPQLLNLQHDALLIFCRMMPIIDKLKVSTILKEISQNFLSIITKSNFRLHVDYDRKTTLKPILNSNIYSIKYTPIQAETFQKYNFEMQIESIKRPIAKNNLIDPLLVDKINFFISVVIGNDEKIFNIVISAILESLEPAIDEGFFGEMYGFMLYIMKKTGNCLVDYIAHPGIFQIDEENDNVNYLITQATKIILKLGTPDSLALCLQSIYAYPHVLEPVLWCLIEHFETVINFCHLNSSILTTIIKLSKHYQQLRVEGNEKAELIGLIVFKILEMLMIDQKLMTTFWTEIQYEGVYLSFILEKNCRKYIFNQLEIYIEKLNGNLDMIILALYNLTESQKFFFPEKNSVESLLDLIIFLSSSICDFPITDIFESLFYSLISNHLFLRKNQLLANYVHECLNLIIRYPSINFDFQTLSQTISLHMHPMPDILISSLLIISQIIRIKIEPDPFSFLIYEMIRDERYLNCYRMIQDELTKNPENAMKIVNSEVDCKILDIVNEKWKNNDQSVLQLLKILELIFSNYSSSLFVQKYMILLKDKDSQFFETAFELIQKLFIKRNRFPYECREILVADVHENVIVNNSVVFVGYVFLSIDEMNRDIHIIFRAENVLNRGIRIVLQSRKLLFEDELHQYHHPSEMIQNSWNFIALVLKKEGNSQFVLNGKIIDIEALFKITPLNIRIGETFSMSQYETKKHPMIGSYLVTENLSLDFITEIYNLGPSRLDLVKNAKILIYPKEKILERNDFINVLVNQCRSDIIFKFFALENYGYEKPLILLHYMLQYNQKSELQFYKRGAFRIISYLILQGDFKYITYSLYVQLYQIFVTIKLNELKYQMIDEILMNSSIWIHADGQNQLSIYIHWANELIPAHYELITESKSFKRFLNQISLFYDQTSSSQFLKNYHIQIPKDFPTVSVRALFSTILIFFAQKNFKFDDFMLMVSYCLTHPDREFSKYITSTMKSVINSYPCPVQSFANDLVPYILELNLFPEISSDSCEILIFLSKSGYISYNLTDLLITFAKSFVIKTTEQFSEYIRLLKKNPDVLMICCVAAKKLGVQAIEMLFSEIYPSKTYATIKNWYIWPLFLFNSATGQTQQLLMRFLICCDPSQWEQIFYMSDIITKDSSAKSVFLSSIVSNILSGDAKINDNAVKSYVSILTDYIFYSFVSSTNPALHSLFINSPFYDENEKIQAEQKIETKSSFSDFLNYVDNYQVRMQEKHFGINIDSNGNWIDAALTMNALSVIEKIGYEDLYFMMCYYLLSSKFDQFIHYIMQLKKSKNENHNNILFFKLFEVTGNQNYIANIPSIAESYFTPFENFVNYMNSEKQFSIITSSLSEFRSYIENSKKLEFSPKDISTMWPHSIEGELQFIAASYYNGYKHWKKVNNFVSSSCLTWLSNEKKHYMRDSTGCMFKCPAYLKVNFSYNDHQKAAVGIEGDEMKIVKTNSERINSSAYKDCEASVQITWISLVNNLPAEMRLYPQEFSFLFSSGKIKKIKYNMISSIRYTTYLHHHDSIFIYLVSRKNYLIRFKNQKERDFICDKIEKKISKSKIKRNMIVNENDSYMKKWLKGEMSNFSYLMYLNNVAGRTFRCASQYPILPWVLIDYKSDKLDLNSPDIYRDFTKPVGAFNEARLNKLKKLMNSLKNLGQPEFLYSNGPQCPMTTYLLLVRLEPFTSLHIGIQDGKFDLAERQFSSIQKLFETVNEDSNDFRELIPEFFYQPEFLVNAENYKLGLEGNGDVILPPWAKTPLEFVYLNRMALESDIVSKNIHHWIDLMFGYKQKGEAAKNSNNIFNPDLYDSVWETSTPEMMKTIELGLQHMGQIPAQLFTKPHPQKIENVLSTTIKKSSFKISYQKIEFAKVNEYKSPSVYCIADQKFIKIDVSSEEEKTTDIYGNAFAYGDGFVITREGNVFYPEAQIKLDSDILCFAYDALYMVSIASDFIIRIYKPNFEIFYSFPLFFGRPLTVSISISFHTVAVGCDEMIALFSLTGNSDVKRIPLPGKIPISSEISKCWGFITVLCKDKKDGSFSVVIYTINGEHVRTVSLKEKVSSMHTFSSQKDKETVIVGCQNGKIYESDSVFLYLREPIFDINEEVVDARIVLKGSAYVIVTKSGTIYTIPRKI